ncbi:MAG: hypothetical protein IJF77_05370 [Alistipes sp.]|nr:hypothetical protein [Alistipes sp.]
MKKLWIIGTLAVMVPWSVMAQVEKQVEVSKNYVPSLEPATKLAIRPDKTDTMQLRPEIDYTITPLSLQTRLATRPIQPARVTYWEFNRPNPFYVKAGVGYPLQSVVDVYASTQNPGTGYALGYLNHEGRYAKIKNDFGLKNGSTRMANRVGAAAGKYLGRHIVEGDVHYDHRLFHRYGAHYPSEWKHVPGDQVGYSDVAATVRVGDDFQDLSRTNFEFKVAGDLFYDHSDLIGVAERGRQSNFGVQGRVARAFAKSRFDIGLGYTWMWGGRALENVDEHLLSSTIRYARHLARSSMEVGVDYYYNRSETATEERTKHYVFPYVRLEFNLIKTAVKPFVEMDGRLQTNDFQSLATQNPYLPASTWLMKSTPEWAVRGGLMGYSKNNRFRYRAYLEGALQDDHIYWLLPVLDEAAPTMYAAGWLVPWQERQTRYTMGAEVTYRPATNWVLDAAARFYAYDDEHKLQNGAPEWEAEFGVRYEGRKVRVGLRAVMQGERWWSMVMSDDTKVIEERLIDRYKMPSAVDVQFDFEWRMSGMMALFVEGRNLLNSDLYDLPTMPEYGINALVGVRLTF